MKERGQVTPFTFTARSADALLFVTDVSKSMDFRGKFELARTVTAILGTLVLDQGDAAGDPVARRDCGTGERHCEPRELLPTRARRAAARAEGVGGVDGSAGARVVAVDVADAVGRIEEGDGAPERRGT